MARNNLKIQDLAKLRNFKKGDDIGQFLSTQFRQINKALEQAYVDSASFYVESQSSGSFLSATAAPVTNLNVKVKSSGLKLWVGLVGLGDSWIQADDTTSSATSEIQILRNNTIIYAHSISTSAAGATATYVRVPSSSVYFVEHDLAPGEYIYSVAVLPTTGNARIYNSKLVAYEF